jgi:hypothetical protein
LATAKGSSGSTGSLLAYLLGAGFVGVGILVIVQANRVGDDGIKHGPGALEFGFAACAFLIGVVILVGKGLHAGE